jgi:hypothetical protein
MMLRVLMTVRGIQCTVICICIMLSCIRMGATTIQAQV